MTNNPAKRQRLEMPKGSIQHHSHINGLFRFTNVLPASMHAVADYFDNEATWFKRFPRFPTAHENGHHVCLDENDKLRDLLRDLLDFLDKQGLCHHALCQMEDLLDTNPQDVTAATMLHKPGWGLGQHIDTYAPDGDGCVVMYTIAKTKQVHRTFRFTQPPLTPDDPTHVHDTLTPNGTLLVFCHEAYEKWMHGSVRNPHQDGLAYSITFRLRPIDSYKKWTRDLPVHHQVVDLAKSMGVTVPHLLSHKFALEHMQRRRKDDAGDDALGTNLVELLGSDHGIFHFLIR